MQQLASETDEISAKTRNKTATARGFHSFVWLVGLYSQHNCSCVRKAVEGQMSHVALGTQMVGNGRPWRDHQTYTHTLSSHHCHGQWNQKCASKVSSCCVVLSADKVLGRRVSKCMRSTDGPRKRSSSGRRCWKWVQTEFGGERHHPHQRVIATILTVRQCAKQP